MLLFLLLGETLFVLKTMLCKLTNELDPIVKETSEDEWLAASGPRTVTLYTRPGCHLCEEAKALINPMLAEFGATLREVSIDESAVLRERYGLDIPVIFIGARKVAKHRVDAVKFRRQLKDAV